MFNIRMDVHILVNTVLFSVKAKDKAEHRSRNMRKKTNIFPCGEFLSVKIVKDKWFYSFD